eukprot:scaffold89014_cov18-Tisochrysis_lutea.AAC.2
MHLVGSKKIGLRLVGCCAEVAGRGCVGGGDGVERQRGLGTVVEEELKEAIQVCPARVRIWLGLAADAEEQSMKGCARVQMTTVEERNVWGCGRGGKIGAHVAVRVHTCGSMVAGGAVG